MKSIQCDRSHYHQQVNCTTIKYGVNIKFDWYNQTQHTFTHNIPLHIHRNNSFEPILILSITKLNSWWFLPTIRHLLWGTAFPSSASLCFTVSWCQSLHRFMKMTTCIRCCIIQPSLHVTQCQRLPLSPRLLVGSSQPLRRPWEVTGPSLSGAKVVSTSGHCSRLKAKAQTQPQNKPEYFCKSDNLINFAVQWFGCEDANRFRSWCWLYSMCFCDCWPNLIFSVFACWFFRLLWGRQRTIREI